MWHELATRRKNKLAPVKKRPPTQVQSAQSGLSYHFFDVFLAGIHLIFVPLRDPS